ncbi:HBL/NHE enterotoxin family protein [Pseudomonas sp. NA-150]|uniref:HBL/NHE enterotoxin family protein n=1 Tax=Pseudomonas sp. NA-150 TaxID=3367525 RepID=UPI0037C77847
MAMNAVLAVDNDLNIKAAATLLTGIQGIGAASVTLQTYCSTVLAQADIGLSILPDLPAQQASARDSAQIWLQKTNSEAIAALAGVRSFSNQVNTYVDAIMPLAQKYDLGDKSQLPLIIKGLQELLISAQVKTDAARTLIDSTQLYKNAINITCAAFADANTRVQSQIEGDTGQLATLRQQLADLNKRMNADIVQISAGAVSDIIGIGMIVIAATTLIETGGATQTILAAGIALVAGGTLAMAISASDIVQAQKEYGSTISELVGLELEVAAFDTVAHQITANQSQAQSACVAAGILAEGWKGVTGSYQQTIDELQQNQQKGYLALRLSALKRSWTNLGAQAHGMMQQGNLAFETQTTERLQQRP